MVTPLPLRLEDETAERVRRSHAACIVELQTTPAARMTIVKSVVLADGVLTFVAHRLGRVPLWAAPSCVRGAVASGRIVETREGNSDLSQFIILTATGYGAAITIDLAVI